LIRKALSATIDGVVKRVFLFFLLPLALRASDTFVRGDVNQDGLVGIGDLVALRRMVQSLRDLDPAEVLLRLGTELPCPDAADLDDNGVVDARDAAAFVRRFFAASSPAVPAPFPLLGPDPTPDPLGPGMGDRPPGGGSDLQFIHFARRVVRLEPGASARIPVLLSTDRAVAGVSFAIKFRRGLFSRADLVFDGTISSREGNRAWRHTTLRSQGKLGATCLFEAPVGWSAGRTVFPVAYLELTVSPGAEPGEYSRVVFDDLPLPWRPSVTWIANEAADPDGTARNLLDTARPMTVVVTRRPDFVRGEVDGDGRIDLADAVFLLTYLFARGSAPGCPDAADVNDDGVITVGDAVFLLGYLFGNAAASPDLSPVYRGPPPPFPNPGPDETPDSLGPCEARPLGLETF